MINNDTNADIVIAQWPQGGWSVVKGRERLERVVKTGKTERSKISFLKCSDPEEAKAWQTAFGDQD